MVAHVSSSIHDRILCSHPFLHYGPSENESSQAKPVGTSVERLNANVMVAQSPAMQRIYRMVDQIANADISVLITGESGTGKEVLARALHSRSPRREGPFVGVNCSAVPEPLLESELFGHVRGAFTDARSERIGLFARADGGTLLLDEIGDLSLGLQPKLLRTIQERVVRPVGSDREVRVDVRLGGGTK